MTSPIAIDFINSTITINASFAKKASNPFSVEYAQLQKVRADYPTFTVLTRTIAKNAAKECYKGLTYDYMRAFIMSHENGEEKTKTLLEFDELLFISQCHSKGRRYPTIKNWFLNKYPEVKEFGMTAAAPLDSTIIKMAEEPKQKTA